MFGSSWFGEGAFGVEDSDVLADARDITIAVVPLAPRWDDQPLPDHWSVSVL